MNREHNRVVVTGLGLVTAIGTGKELFWSNLLQGTSNICGIPEEFESGYHFKSRYYVPFPDVSISQYGFPARYECLMEGSTRVAAVASRLAVIDAGLNWDTQGMVLPIPSEHCIIILGTGICPLEAGFKAFRAHEKSRQMAFPETEHPAHFNRMVIPMIMPDAASSWVSILSGIKGENYTINASCASGTIAIGEAFRKIRSGEAGMALAGGTECLHDASGTVMRGFDGLGTLTTASDGRPLPFSKNRSGFLFAEGGACVLVLETFENARARGAEIYAEIIGFTTGSDAHNIVQMDESGAGIEQVLQPLIRNVTIDYFNAHGTATGTNDEVEASVIRKLFGHRDQQPLVNSTKGITGHAIGASGAIEAAVTALSIKNSMVHLNVTDQPMDDLNLPMESIPCEVHNAISASYGFGGHNAALLFRKI